MAEPTPCFGKRWAITDSAFLLNYADHCLNLQKDYRSTVVKALAQYRGRQSSYGAIELELKGLLGLEMKQYDDFVDGGTASINVVSLPVDLLEAMQDGRKDLKLEKLLSGSAGDNAESSERRILNPTRNTVSSSN